MKIIRVKNHLAITLEDGSMLSKTDCTDEFYNEVLELKDDEEAVKELMIPNFLKAKKEIEVKIGLIDNLETSKVFKVFGNSIYIESISQLTLPEDLALAIFKAEQEGDIELIKTYKNFWTLASANPDSRARTNLFWFLNKYGMVISKSGLFVAYRNVQLKEEGTEIHSDLAKFVSSEYVRIKTKLKKSPKKYFIGYKTDEKKELMSVPKKKRLKVVLGTAEEMYNSLKVEEVSPTYTDAYSRKMIIKIGKPVTISRSQCDAKQENTCSSGLHVAGKGWLSKGSFGQVGMKVLVNPADVVAVPPSDNYGKMRVCAYYPIAVIEWLDAYNMVENDIEDGFEDDFMHRIAYDLEVNNEDHGNYVIEIPEIPELDSIKMRKNLKKISDSLKKKIAL